MYIHPSPLCPIEHLPTPFLEAVIHGCQRTEAPPEVVVADVLAVTSTITQRLYKVRGINGSVMPISLNTLSLAPTATGKGESYRMFFQEPADVETDESKAPADRMTIDGLLLQDVSPSALMSALAGHGKSASIQLEDGFAFLGGRLMHRDTISKLTQVCSGPPSLKVARHHDSKDAIEPCLAIGLRIQPELFYRFLRRDKGDSRDLGFWPRFLTFCYDPERFPATRWNAASSASMASYLPLMERLSTLLPPADAPPGSDEPARTVLVLDTFANAHLREIAYWLKAQMNGQFHDIQDAAGRAAEITLRLASNFHVVCHGEGLISREMIERAWAFAEWSLAQFRNVFVHALQPPPKPLKLRQMKPPRLPHLQQRLNADMGFMIECISACSAHAPQRQIHLSQVALLSGFPKARFLRTLGWLLAARLIEIDGEIESGMVRLSPIQHFSPPGGNVPRIWTKNPV